MKAIIIATVALVIGPIFFVAGLKEKFMIDRLNKEGVEVDGRPTEGEFKRSRRSNSYEISVMYQVADGGMITKRFDVTQDFFDRLVRDGRITRETVKVRYLPGEPGTAILPDGSTDAVFMLYAGPVIFLAGLGYLAYRGKKRKGEDSLGK